MNKVTGVVSDFMMVCVLLVAFILPIIVSFNFIPKLYVAEVKESATVSSNSILGEFEDATVENYEFLTDVDVSENANVEINKDIKGATVIDVTLFSESITESQQSLFLGNLVNNFGSGKYKVSILRGNDTSDNLKLNISLNKVKFNEDTVLLQLNKNQKSVITLNYQSETKLNYDQSFKIVIERIND